MESIYAKVILRREGILDIIRNAYPPILENKPRKQPRLMKGSEEASEGD
jgi:hypothetical protein